MYSICETIQYTFKTINKETLLKLDKITKAPAAPYGYKQWTLQNFKNELT